LKQEKRYFAASKGEILSTSSGEQAEEIYENIQMLNKAMMPQKLYNKVHKKRQQVF